MSRLIDTLASGLVNNAGSGSGGGGEWGTISGTLSDQTDLQTALNGRIDLNGNNAAITYTNFSPSAAPAYQEGRVWYDADTDSISYYDNHAGTSVQVGKELVVTARNNSGGAISNGQVVYISGAIGQNPTIAPARADSLTTSEIIGVATHDISNNSTGKVTVFGLVNDIDTSGFTDGQQVYLSAATAGSLTATPPASPNFVVFVGYIAHAHVTQGKLLVMSDRAIANNNVLGTSQSISPTQNAVKEYVDGIAASISASTQIDQSGGTSDTYGVLVGAVNGSNTDYTVSMGQYPTGKLLVYLNGQLQIQGTDADWIELNPAIGTFRFNAAPFTGDLITVEYGKTQSLTGTLAWGDITGTLSSQTDLNTVLNNRVTRTGDRGIVLAAGSTTAGTAPLKFTEQVSPLSVIEQGAMELVGHSLQFSQYLKRRGVMMSSDVRTSDLTVANTITESAAIVTAQHGANYLEVGKCEELVVKGFMSQRNNAAAFGTFRVKYAGVTIQSLLSPASTAMTNVPFEIKICFTCRTTGVSGTARVDAIMVTGGSVSIDPGTGGTATIDTTTEQNTTLTFQWNEANAADTITFTQAYVVCIEPNR